MSPEPNVEVLRIRDLRSAERAAARDVVKAVFTGYYRWHANRCLRDVETVRGIVRARRVEAFSIVERLAPEVGYVTYLIVDPRMQRHGLGGRLLDDALERFRRSGAQVAYAVVSRANRPSVGLVRSRGFRPVRRRERSFRNGGLGAWGVRAQMHIVPGESVFGRRLAPVPIPAGPRRAIRP